MSSSNSPAASVGAQSLLTLENRSRRGSLVPASEMAAVDKEQLAQALDKIHSTACQSETLTMFNEFSSPPPSLPNSESKRLTGDIVQNGLSGLYSRFRGAVGVGKDTIAPRTGDAVGGETASARSSTATTTTKDNNALPREDRSANSISTHPPSPISQISSPAASSLIFQSSESQSQGTKSSKTSVVSTPAMSKSVISNRTATTPSMKTAPALTIAPSTAILNASAIKDSGKSGNLGYDGFVTEKSNAGGPENPTSPSSHLISTGFEQSAKADADTPRQAKGAATGTLVRHESEAIRDSDEYSRAISRASDHDRESLREDASFKNRNQSQDDSKTASSALSSIQWMDPSRASSRLQVTETPKRAKTVDRIAQSHLPGYQASRASSTDRSTIETSPIGSVSLTGARPQGVSVDDTAGGLITRRQIPSLATNEGNLDLVNARLEQMKKQVLSKEFWMADAICKECFLCGDAFSAFRRKHHCRTCGCIFDSKCTSIISGQRFGVHGSLRVCKTCLNIINRRHDSSGSDDTDDDSALPTFFQSQQSKFDSNKSELPPKSPQNHPQEISDDPARPLATPMMAIPATRRIGDSTNRRSAILEIDAPQLSRPSSARSLKSLSIAGRPPSSGHKRHQSKHSFFGRFIATEDERAPFHRGAADDLGKKFRLPAFHDDNIIDPDLAPYMSDEGSSTDEQMGIFATLNSNNVASASFENDRTGFGSLLSANKRHRARVGEKSVSGVSFTSRGLDDLNGSSSLAAFSRPSRRRNLSTTNANYHARTPQRQLVQNLVNLNEKPITSEVLSATATPVSSGLTRSVSMSGNKAVELNNASLHHVRRLLHQLLQDANVSNVSSWEVALIPILLQCTDDVDPDVRHGDDIDIRHYVKLKKIPGGKPGDTSYVSGVVFTKNLALKSMPRHISNPRIVIVSFPIEYQRHQHHFMSLEPVIAQEKEFLRNMVNRIASLRPQLLLVQKHVSGLALQYLSEANIAVAYNVKQSVIEAVSRCAQTEIISSIDMVALKPVHIGKSAGFDVKTFVHNDIPGKKKTYTYLSGCPKELGCTIVLRGASMAVLSKMKRITEFMVYVVYNLKLETCLMRDEFVLIPSVADNSGRSSPGRQHISTNHQGGPPSRIAPQDAILEAANKLQESITISGRPNDTSNVAVDKQDLQLSGLSSPRPFDDIDITKPSDISQPAEQNPTPKFVSAHESHAHGSQEDQLPEDIPMPTFYSDMVAKHQTKLLSASPFVKFMLPYLLMRAREQERRLVYLKRLRDQDTFVEQTESEKSKAQRFQLIKPEMVHETVKGAPRQIMEVLHAVHDAEYDKALHNYQTQTRQWENYIQGNLNLFDPYAHQNIVVLYTVVCTATTIPCAGPELLALAFYNEHEISREFDPDCTLGQYVEDLCLSANTICTSNGCEQRMSEHHRTYVHGEARITVFVEKSPCKINGLQDSILMWSYCKICQKDTQVMPMSESTWKYSLGKYLELSFWSSELRLRAGICPHDLHRDHLRYFGYRNMAIRIHYDPIDLLEIIVPRTRITWKVDNDLRLKNDLFTKIEERWNRFMSSVNSRIKGINIDSVAPEKAEACKAEVERLLKRSQEEQIALIRKLQDKYMESKYYEIIPLNRAVRAMQEKVAEWDDAFADFDANFFPSEKDIRRLAALQLKKMFMDRDESTTSLVSAETTDLTSDLDEKAPKSSSDANRNSSRTSIEEPSSTLNSVLIGDFVPQVELIDGTQTAGNAPAESFNTRIVDQDRIQHLDLAVAKSSLASQASETPSSQQASLSLTIPSDKEAVSTIQSTSEAATPSARVNASQELTDFVSSDITPKPIVNRSETSGIPRPTDRGDLRRSGTAASPPLNRAQSQPIPTVRRLPQTIKSQTDPSEAKAPLDVLAIPMELPRTSTTDLTTKPTDKKLSERLGLSALKQHRKVPHSLIPRSVHGKPRESKVSTLAKHFDQLSREFEKERMRDRRQRAAKVTQSRAFPKASSKPIVEVYKDVNEAVEERTISSEEGLSSQGQGPEAKGTISTSPFVDESKSFSAAEAVQQPRPNSTAATEDTATEVETDDNLHTVSQTASDDDEAASDGDDSMLDDTARDEDTTESLRSEKRNTETPIEIPKHEKSSLMKMLTNFWAERSASGWTPLEYPINASDHIFADEDVIVREDEPSSLIAFTLQSEHYRAKLNEIRSQGRQSKEREISSNLHNKTGPDGRDDRVNQAEVETSLLRATGTHLAYSFVDSSARMQCKIFFAEQFDAVRRKCGVADRIVESLSRCLKWDSKGGKTKSVFLKTLDDRLVLKSLSPIETQAFLKFAPAYFNIMAEVLFHDLPSVIAKMLGFYQIIIKNPVTGTEIKWDVLVMENLFYDRSPTRIFDLKGSMRNRKIQSTGEQNEVLLDENMVEFIYESPLFTREHSKKLLRAAIFNDTLFLQRNDVMDYSLMVAVDEKRKELVVGIIDVVRTYTWDKKLESWIKDRGFAGGGRNRPTVTSPKEYKNRFREAMNRYILQAPNSWHQWQSIQSRPRQELKGSTAQGEVDPQ